MVVRGPGDCILIHVMSDNYSLLLTPRNTSYTLLIIDCLTRFGLAIPIPKKSEETVVYTTLHHYILINSTEC